MQVLSQKGLQKIAGWQDKYKFRDTFEITDPDEVLDFLRAIKEAYYLGLSLEVADNFMIDEMIDKLTS